MKRIVLLCCAFSVSAFAEWTLLEDCKLLRNDFNDGDSFLLECSAKYRGEVQHRLRLYFVDTAETSSNSEFMKKRLLEQAAYWGSDDPDFASRMGLRAQQKVRKLLSGRFDAYTQGEYAPTLGRPRLYAMVRVNDRWLSEILVEEGLVRIHGNGTAPPDRTSRKAYRSLLRRLERTAKSEHRNGWSRSSDEPVEEAPAVFEPHDAVLRNVSWIYSIKDGRKVTALPSGTQVTVVAPGEQSRVRVRFKKNGKVYEGLCDKRNLDE